MAVTINDVAKYAGVSIGTVSRAINGYTDIRLETRERVLQAIDELGYTPNVIGKGLSSKRKNAIGVIVSGLMDSNRNDNISYLILQGIYRYASQYDLEVSMYVTDSNKQRMKSYARFCTERNIAGAVLSGITTTDAYFQELIQSHIPCMAIDIPIVADKVGHVSIDNVAGGRTVAQYVIEMGHKEIIIIGGKGNTTVTSERELGIRDVFSQADMWYCDFSEQVAYQRTFDYIQSTPPNRRATAFICMSDIMAIGCMHAIEDCGLSVPNDFSVTGFDDLPFTQFVRPGITTVRQDFSEAGYQATAHLWDIINGKEKGERVVLPHELIVRASVLRQ